MREISEVQHEVGEIVGEIRVQRIRLQRLVKELEQDHMTRDEAWLRMVEDKAPPNVQYYLQGALEVVEAEELTKAEDILKQASKITDEELAAIWRSGDDHDQK